MFFFAGYCIHTPIRPCVSHHIRKQKKVRYGLIIGIPRSSALPIFFFFFCLPWGLALKRLCSEQISVYKQEGKVTESVIKPESTSAWLFRRGKTSEIQKVLKVVFFLT